MTEVTSFTFLAGTRNEEAAQRALLLLRRHLSNRLGQLAQLLNVRGVLADCGLLQGLLGCSLERLATDSGL